MLAGGEYPLGSGHASILGLVDTAVGVAVGVAGAWLGANAMRVTKLFGRDNSPNADAGERA